MPNPRLFSYARALERVYDADPSAAHAIEQYVADLRSECARRRQAARDSPPQTTAALRPSSTNTPPRRNP